MIAQSSDRVPAHTDPQVNEKINRQAQMRIDYYRSHPQEIPRRLRELDAEWDVERALETAASSFSLFGLIRGTIFGQKRWLVVPLVVQAFFLQHALQGWCPPLPVLRRLGFRTVREIDEEKYALLALSNGRTQSDPAAKIRSRKR